MKKVKEVKDAAQPVKDSKSTEGLQKQEDVKDMLKRLKRTEGQLRGIQKMIEDGKDCKEIGHQFSAAIKSLESTYMRMVVCVAAQGIDSVNDSPVEKEAVKADVLKNLASLLSNSR